MCTICGHHEREEIDRALVAGEPSRKIAARYGSLSRAAVQRHGDQHLPAELTKAREAGQVARADDLLTRLGELTGEARRIGGKAEDEGDYRAALAAVRELVRIVELQGKLAGELNEEAPTVNVTNVAVSQEWIDLRTRIVVALESHPDARDAVLSALEGAGNGGA